VGKENQTLNDVIKGAAADVYNEKPAEQEPPANQPEGSQKPPEQTPPEQKPPEKKPDAQPAAQPKGDEIDFNKIDIPDDFLNAIQDHTKPAQAPAEKPASEEPEELKQADSKTRETFGKMRTQLREAQEENARLKAAQKTVQLHPQAEETIKQAIAYKAQAEELQGKLNQAYDQLGAVSLERDPRFKAKYENQQKAIVSSIKKVAGEWEVKEDVIEECLRLSPRKRAEKIADVAPGADTVLNPYFAQYDHIEEMKQLDLQNHKETRAGLAVEDNKKSQAARISLTQAALAKVIQEGHPAFRKVEGNDGWNKIVDGVHGRIKATILSENPAVQIESMVLGAAAPLYLVMLAKERAKRVQLEKELNLRNKARGSLASDQSESGAPKPIDKMTAKDAAAMIFKSDE
jgi:hypothetical protein